MSTKANPSKVSDCYANAEPDISMQIAKTRSRGGRPRSARPPVRSAISMRAEDADLIHSVLVHAIATGVIERPPIRLNGQPFAGSLPLLVMFCREYAERNEVEIVKYDPSKTKRILGKSVGM